MATRRRIIIDTDPGIDDAMAIACAFNSSEVEVIGLTTIFGNVRTEQATSNAHILLKLAGKDHIPIAEGSSAPLQGVLKDVASFVHGDDGLGNTALEPVQSRVLDKPAARFIADSISESPGSVTILALGPLTNVAMAFQLDPSTPDKMEELVLLGGAFDVEGNVNPAAEANILGDPDAADYVFGQTHRIRAVGLDVTLKCCIQQPMLQQLKASSSSLCAFLLKAVQFYLKYHRSAYGIEGFYAHDPSAFLALVRPELFTWREGEVRVICDGIARGKTLQDPNRKQWNKPNPWTGRPKVKVAVDMDVQAAIDIMISLMAM